MSNLKKDYDEIKKQREKIIEELKLLSETDVIKKYFELKKQCEVLDDKQSNLYKEIKNEEYKCCEHILVCSEIDRDEYEGRVYRSYGCIKCDLEESVSRRYREYLPFYQKIMYDYLDGRYIRSGMETKLVCNLDLAKAIYSKIKEAHPDIDDETARKYFEISLDDIRNIKVNDERKKSRAKRLSLNPDFNKWI